MPLSQKDQRYTYADYCTWDDGQRWELMEGVPYAMSPEPTSRHQEISGELFRRIANFLDGKPCKVFHAPFDVRLNADGDDDTVLQPDISVICDRNKIDERGCNGAPDLVVEIISPSTARHDRMIKFEQYRRAGVREYWIVDPDIRTVQLFLLGADNLYVAYVYSDEDTAPVSVLPGCEIDLGRVFTEQEEKEK